MICCYEMRKGRGSCVEPSSLKNFGSMFDAEAIHAQIPSNIEPNYQRTWCNGHKTGHASVLSSYIANLPCAMSAHDTSLSEKGKGRALPLGRVTYLAGNLKGTRACHERMNGEEDAYAPRRARPARY